MNKNTLRAILTHLFSAVSAICMFCTVLFSVLNITLKNSDKTDDGFFNTLSNELVSELEAYAPSTGVDESFFATSFDKSDFEKHTSDYITACFNGTERPDIRSDIKERFYVRLCDYADKEGYMLTDDITAALSNLADICADKYTSYSSGSITGILFSYLGKICRAVDRYEIIVYAAIAVVMCVCIWGLWKITAVSDRFSRACIILTASAFMCGAAPLWVMLSNVTNRIGITSVAIKGYITSLVNGVLHGCLIFAAVFAVLAITVFGTGVFIKNNENQKK